MGYQAEDNRKQPQQEVAQGLWALRVLALGRPTTDLQDADRLGVGGRTLYKMFSARICVIDTNLLIVAF